MKKTLCLLLLVALTIGSLLKPSLSSAQQPGAQGLSERPSNNQVIFVIPVSEETIKYADENSEEKRAWGPTSLRVAPNGTFFIADPVGNNILQFNRQGELLKKINVDAVGITDLAVDDTTILTLDEAAETPTVLRLSVEGEIQERMTLPMEIREEGLSGLAVGQDGEIFAEIKGGLARKSMADKLFLKGRAQAGVNQARVSEVVFEKLSDQTAMVELNGNNVELVAVPNFLGTIKLLSVNPSGDFYVLIEEVASIPAIAVDQTVRHYSANGELLGAARVPVAESYISVSHGVAVAPDGEVYALITKPDRLEVIRLSFEQELQPILPAPGDDNRDRRQDGRDPQLYAAAACRSTQSMTSTAQGYTSNSVYLSNANINGYCAGRGKPRYLGSSAGYKSSVAYDWGGFDTVSAYNSHMQSGKQAGDINTAGVESCSRGG